MPSRIVRPETTKLTISSPAPGSPPDWLLVKKRLTHGEESEAFARRYVSENGGARPNLTQQTGMALVTAYLVDWSLLDLDEKPLAIRGQPIEVVEAALNAIDEDSFNEIHSAIVEHETAMEKERAAQKKILTESSNGAPTSGSPSEPGGPSSGSAS